MARCWTCGSEIHGGLRYLFTCPTCEGVQEIKSLRKTAFSNPDEFVQVQRHGFEILSDRLSEVAAVIEWGFGEINWQLQQQTDVLRSIDHTLKTPSQTKANEWRLHAEELRRRGVLEESEEFFLKALNDYRLDYRIYVGLAETYLQMGKFDKAKVYLEKSLPHAPKGSKELAAWCADCQTWVWVESDACSQCHGSRLSNQYFATTGIDWRSYSYRLIGHIYACEEDYSHAMEILHTAIELSPTYENGHYDYAQYCAQKRNKETCLSSLRKSILAEPLYWYLAQKEKNFDPLRSDVEILLSDIYKEASHKAKDDIEKSENVWNKALGAVSEPIDASKVSIDKVILDSISILKNAETKLKLAKDKVVLAKDKVASGDYIAFLEAIQVARESYIVANNALNTANTAAAERKNYQRKMGEQIEETWTNFLGVFIIGSLFYGLIGGIVGGIGRGDWIGFVLGFLVGILIAFIFAINKYNILK